ncbi:MAG: hypothetical protein JNM78_13830 [Cyclobacteriaceae bacterium]|nr:hypothetical protein [Cyclobacteriaceae bacterium]
MEKQTDQELDSLFKAAAEGIKPEYEVAAWEGMTERLDAVSKSPTVFNKWILLSLLGIIIFTGGVWMGYTLNNTSAEPDVKKNTDQILTESKTVSIDNQNLSEKTTSQQKKSEADDYQIQNSSSQNSNTDQRQRVALVKEKQNANDGVTEKNAVKEEHLNVDHREVNDLQDNELGNVSNLQQDDKDSNKLFFSKPKIESIPAAEKKAKHESDSTKLDSKKEEDQQKIFAKGIFVRGLASPDFSSVNFGSSGSIGSNYALLVEYQFANRWSVSTGAIRSFKKYSSNGEITYSGRTADDLDGSCRILDIPLNFYYRLNPFSKTSFFGGVGLSSYLMLSEDYNFTVYTNNGDRVYSKQVKKENNEWFKVLNLSVGIQHQLNSRLYVQAEPFLKAPLAGMGYGEVRLSSLGVFFGVKFKLY